MIVECTTCGARYTVADEKVSPEGTKFKCKKCGSLFHALHPASEMPMEEKRAQRPGATISGKKINPHLFTFPIWIGLIAMVFGLMFMERRSEAIGAVFALGGVAGIIFAVIYGFVALYRAWHVIPEAYARTTPGKAVGFLFIPFFNLYWVFVAIKGLADDANSFLARAGVGERKISPGLSLAYCIFYLLGIVIPFVPVVTTVLLTILVFQWAGFVEKVLDNPRAAQQAYQPGHQRKSGGAATVAMVLAAIFGGIAVLGMLAAISIPAFLGQRQKARMRAVESNHLAAVTVLEEEISKCASGRGAVTADVVAHLNSQPMYNPFAEELEAFSYGPGMGQVAISHSDLRSLCGTDAEVIVASDTDGDGEWDMTDSVYTR